MNDEFKSDALPAGSFSLSLLLCTISAIGLFLALFKISPTASIFATLILAPTLMRTVVAIQAWRRVGRFRETMRVRIFLVSLGIVSLTLLAGVLSTSLACLAFGFSALLFEFSIAGTLQQNPDVFVLGATSGLIPALGCGLIGATAVISGTWPMGMPATHPDPAGV